MPEQAGEASGSFFRKGNLIALRELALRRTAERGGRADARSTGASTASPGPGPRPSGSWSASARARSPRASCGPPGGWPPGFAPSGWSSTSRRRPAPASRTRSADRVGQTPAPGRAARRRDGHARRATTSATEVLAFARSRNVTKIVVGKPHAPALARGAVRLGRRTSSIRGSGDIDVYVITGEREGPQPPPPERPAPPVVARLRAGRPASWPLCTGVAALMFPHFEPTDLVMVYLLGVVLVAGALRARARRSSPRS